MGPSGCLAPDFLVGSGAWLISVEYISFLNPFFGYSTGSQF